MDNIGNIIRLYREKLGLSQKELSRDLCSVKYIYLVEKGQRNPSAFMLRQLGSRLHVNLFDLYQYAGCEDPINVCETIKLFEKDKRNSNFEHMKILTEAKSNMTDFTKAPWSCEILMNRCIYKIFVENAVDEVITELTHALNDFSKYSGFVIYKTRILLLLSICYQKNSNTEQWRLSNKAAMELMLNAEQMMPYAGYFQYVELVISVTINRLFLLLHTRDFEDLNTEAIKLLDYQIDSNIVGRTHYTYFFLCLSNDGLGDRELAYRYLRKTVYSSMVEDKTADVAQFVENALFRKLLHDYGTAGFVSDFCSQYGIKKEHEQLFHLRSKM